MLSKSVRPSWLVLFALVLLAVASAKTTQENQELDKKGKAREARSPKHYGDDDDDDDDNASEEEENPRGKSKKPKKSRE